MAREPTVEEQVAADLVASNLGGRVVHTDDGTASGVHDFEIVCGGVVVALEVTTTTDQRYRKSGSARKAKPKAGHAVPGPFIAKMDECVQANVDKLRRATATERHLSVWVDAVEVSVWAVLDGEYGLPALVLPGDVDELWAAQQYGGRESCAPRRAWRYGNDVGWSEVPTGFSSAC